MARAANRMSEGSMRMVGSFVEAAVEAVEAVVAVGVVEVGGVLTRVYMCSKRGRGGAARRTSGAGRCMPRYRRTRAVREASSSRTTARRESGEIVARQGKGVDGDVVQRGRSSGDAAGFVLTYAAPVCSVTQSD